MSRPEVGRPRPVGASIRGVSTGRRVRWCSAFIDRRHCRLIGAIQNFFAAVSNVVISLYREGSHIADRNAIIVPPSVPEIHPRLVRCPEPPTIVVSYQSPILVRIARRNINWTSVRRPQIARLVLFIRVPAPVVVIQPRAIRRPIPPAPLLIHDSPLVGDLPLSTQILDDEIAIEWRG